MPALPLSKERLADAQRLARIYAKWKAACVAKKVRASQEIVAVALGFSSQSSVSQYIKGGIPLNKNAVIKFAEFFGVSPSDISPEIAKEIAEYAQAIAVDGLSDAEEHAPVHLVVDVKISAEKRLPVFSTDERKTLMFRRDWLARHGITKEKDAACFEVDGRSMVDAGIPDESIVIVNLREIEPLPNRIYLVRTEKGLIVKQLVQESGRWVARSCNEAEKKDYPDLPVGTEARIIGRAFWCGFGL